MRISDWSSDVCSSDLYVNDRTTDEIRKQAVALLEGVEIDDLDGGSDEDSRYKSLSHGPAPKLAKADGLEAAAQEIIAFIKEWRARSEEHTSELQSLMRISYAVFCLKKKTQTRKNDNKNK